MKISALIDALLEGVTIEINAKIKLKSDRQGQGRYVAVCNRCGWRKWYTTQYNAIRGKSDYQAHCSICSEDIPDWIEHDTSANEQNEQNEQ